MVEKNSLENSFYKQIFYFLEFRELLELFERTSSLVAKIELDEQIHETENILIKLKQQFMMIFNEKINAFNEEKIKNFELLRPTFGQPARKNDLQVIDKREQIRQDSVQKMINELQSNTIVNNSFFTNPLKVK
jgi:hypothetical protein